MSEKIIGIICLGYVGLPLAATFGQHHPTLGFDIKPEALIQLRNKIDHNGEVDEAGFTVAKHLEFIDDARALQNADFLIVAAPTPIDHAKQPDLTPLIIASEIAGTNMKRGAVVIF